MTKPGAPGAALVAILVIGCGAPNNNTAAADSALAVDIQPTNRDTVGQPPLTDVPKSEPTRTTKRPPSDIVGDLVRSGRAPRDTMSMTATFQESDTIGVRAIRSGAPLSRADSAAIETQLRNLRAASIDFFAPDTLFISRPELVRIVIDPETASPPTNRGGRIRPTTTRVGFRTEVCLSAPGLKVDDEEGTDKHCRTQVVPFTAPSQWHWTVTALPEIKTSGIRPIDITVNALLDSLPKYTVYTTHHTAYVHVDEPGILQKVSSMLTTWQAILVAIAAIVGVLYPFVKWLAPRLRKT